MEGNLKNITVSPRAYEIMETIKTEGYFSNKQEAYRAAIAVALANKLPIDREVKMTENKWDTAAVFNSKESNVEALLLLTGIAEKSLVDEGKLLAEAGLRFLEMKRQSNSDVLSFLVAK